MHITFDNVKFTNNKLKFFINAHSFGYNALIQQRLLQ